MVIELPEQYACRNHKVLSEIHRRSVISIFFRSVAGRRVHVPAAGDAAPRKIASWPPANPQIPGSPRLIPILAFRSGVLWQQGQHKRIQPFSVSERLRELLLARLRCITWIAIEASIRRQADSGSCPISECGRIHLSGAHQHLKIVDALNFPVTKCQIPFERFLSSLLAMINCRFQQRRRVSRQDTRRSQVMLSFDEPALH